MRPDFDVIVLAGGSASRLGGADKPGLVLGERNGDFELPSAQLAHRALALPAGDVPSNAMEPIRQLFGPIDGPPRNTAQIGMPG